MILTIIVLLMQLIFMSLVIIEYTGFIKELGVRLESIYSTLSKQAIKMHELDKKLNNKE